MKKKTAIIFGVTGQDGSYLAKLLLNKKYVVHGVIRKSSSINTNRIDDIYQDNFKKKRVFYLHYGDLTDSSSIKTLIHKYKPDEIYNLAAQSHVKVSFDVPEYTADVDALGTLRILEAIKDIKKKIRFYQASTSEMFGKVREIPQNENTPFYPRSPYGVSKVFSYWMTVNYREAYNIYAVNGILFNHESPVRGDTFVTKKIIKALCKIKYGFQKKLYLGNLEAKRDWGHARDYVYAMWLMLKQKTPTDLVIATNKTYSVKYFINRVCKFLNLKIKWKGKGIKTKAIFNGKVIIECHKNYYRPSEVDKLLGDYSKAKKLLKWKPTTSLDQLIIEMIDYELKLLK
ncbi:GDP-mannose 4,6-dehydratase [Pelagibacterales bacterium SAG-MED10]|nr:GDP-mannose 4,6-dehydratase [Pelagibacterales bacterium SAG-MED10]